MSGFVQLLASGVDKLIFNDEPDIDFFKIVYRRHTNFYMMPFLLYSNDIIYNTNTIVDYIIPKNGDLVSDMFIVLESYENYIDLLNTNDKLIQTQYINILNFYDNYYIKNYSKKFINNIDIIKINYENLIFMNNSFNNIFINEILNNDEIVLSKHNNFYNLDTNYNYYSFNYNVQNTTISSFHIDFCKIQYIRIDFLLLNINFELHNINYCEFTNIFLNNISKLSNNLFKYVPHNLYFSTNCQKTTDLLLFFIFKNINEIEYIEYYNKLDKSSVLNITKKYLNDNLKEFYTYKIQFGIKTKIKALPYKYFGNLTNNDFNEYLISQQNKLMITMTLDKLFNASLNTLIKMFIFLYCQDEYNFINYVIDSQTNILNTKLSVFIEKLLYLLFEYFQPSIINKIKFIRNHISNVHNIKYYPSRNTTINENIYIELNRFLYTKIFNYCINKHYKNTILLKNIYEKYSLFDLFIIKDQNGYTNDLLVDNNHINENIEIYFYYENKKYQYKILDIITNDDVDTFYNNINDEFIQSNINTLNNDIKLINIIENKNYNYITPYDFGNITNCDEYDILKNENKMNKLKKYYGDIYEKIFLNYFIENLDNKKLSNYELMELVIKYNFDNEQTDEKMLEHKKIIEDIHKLKSNDINICINQIKIMYNYSIKNKDVDVFLTELEKNNYKSSFRIFNYFKHLEIESSLKKNIIDDELNIEKLLVKVNNFLLNMTYNNNFNVIFTNAIKDILYYDNIKPQKNVINDTWKKYFSKSSFSVNNNLVNINTFIKLYKDFVEFTYLKLDDDYNILNSDNYKNIDNINKYFLRNEDAKKVNILYGLLVYYKNVKDIKKYTVQKVNIIDDEKILLNEFLKKGELLRIKQIDENIIDYEYDENIGLMNNITYVLFGIKELLTDNFIEFVMNMIIKKINIKLTIFKDILGGDLQVNSTYPIMLSQLDNMYGHKKFMMNDKYTNIYTLIYENFSLFNFKIQNRLLMIILLYYNAYLTYWFNNGQKFVFKNEDLLRHVVKKINTLNKPLLTILNPLLKKQNYNEYIKLCTKLFNFILQDYVNNNTIELNSYKTNGENTTIMELNLINKNIVNEKITNWVNLVGNVYYFQQSPITIYLKSIDEESDINVIDLFMEEIIKLNNGFNFKYGILQCINFVELYFDDMIVDTITNLYFQVYLDLFLDVNKLKTIDEMLGTNATMFSKTECPYIVKINKNVFYLPIPMFFQKKSNSIVLIANMYNSVKMRLETNKNYLIDNYFNYTSITNVKSIFKTGLNMNYIYVEKIERISLTDKILDNLIEKHNMFSLTKSITEYNINENDDFYELNFNFNLNNPIKELFWTLELYINDFQYTIEENININPFILSFIITINGIKRDGIIPYNIIPPTTYELATNTYTKTYESYIALNTYLASYKYNTRSDVKSPFYLYSFAFYPEEFQPSGAINMSLNDFLGIRVLIDRNKLDDYINNILIENEYNINFNNVKKFGLKMNLMTFEYNILRYQSALSGLLFSK